MLSYGYLKFYIGHISPFFKIHFFSESGLMFKPGLFNERKLVEKQRFRHLFKISYNQHKNVPGISLVALAFLLG